MLRTSGVDYAQAVRTLHALGRQVAAFFQDCDLLLTPTLAIPPDSEIQLPPVVVGRAAGRVQYANSLARRGATFSAEREFVGSLRMIAEAGDAQCGSNCYTQTLALALTAMEEAGDFQSHETKAMLNVKTHDIVSRHQS